MMRQYSKTRIKNKQFINKVFYISIKFYTHIFSLDYTCNISSKKSYHNITFLYKYLSKL